MKDEITVVRPENAIRLIEFNGDYIRGYTKAIQMIQEQFDGISKDLKHHRKRPTEKLIKEFLDCCLKERAILRDWNDSFVRWNKKKEEFEIWREAWSKEDANE